MGDTGGSASAGTVMGKLNAIISSLANIGGSSVNASDITAIKTATAATTTENASGTLSAKLSYLINRRDYIITPSSTNLKTLTNNLSVSIAAQSNVSNTYVKSTNSSKTSGVTIIHDGVYRFYFTCSGASNSGGSVSGRIDVFRTGSGQTSTHSITFGSNAATISSTTKTIDIPLKRGDIVYCYLRAEASAVYFSCGGYYLTTANNLSCTEISMRGTASEINKII